MPTDPYVPITLDEEPRQETNLAPGSHMPPSGSWRADRPGDLGAIQPKGALLGSPGPNVGYALTLANRARDRLNLEAHEAPDDALAVVAAIAMKRAATFGRAPTVTDIDFAMELLGYLGDAPEDVRTWRPEVVRAAAHDYVVRRAVVDTVSSGLLRFSIAELPEHLAIVREAMARAAEEAAAATEGDDVDLGEVDAGEETGEVEAVVADAPEDAPGDPAAETS
ncbi:MAG: hypothetical protein ACXVIM_01045 [Acidimicrobiia bacterium]